MQAQLLVIQDLLKTVLVQQGASKESIDEQCSAAINSYREILTQKFGERLAEYKEPLIKALNLPSINND